MENALQTITEALENAEVQGWRSRILDYSKPIPMPKPLVTINGEILSFRQNIVTITGAPKTCKSTFLASIAAACLSGGEVITLKAEKPLKILYLDTEQSEYYIVRQVERIFRLAKMEKKLTDNFVCLALRKSTLAERYEYLCESVESLRPDIVFLDGAADLVLDVNNGEACKEFVDNLEQLVENFNCGLITVVHNTPLLGKVRGHLGSELERKSENIILLQKDKIGNTLEISPKENRNRGFEKFVCFISDNGDLEYRSKEVCPRTCQDWLLYLMEPHIEYQNCTLVKMLKKQGFAKSTTIEALQEAVKNGSVIKNGAKYTVALWENDDEDDNEDDEEN